MMFRVNVEEVGVTTANGISFNYYFERNMFKNNFYIRSLEIEKNKFAISVVSLDDNIEWVQVFSNCNERELKEVACALVKSFGNHERTSYLRILNQNMKKIEIDKNIFKLDREMLDNQKEEYRQERMSRM